MKVIIKGKIKPKERPRQGKSWNGKRVFYTPKETLNSECKIAKAFCSKYPNMKPLDCAVELIIKYGRKVPSGTSKKTSQSMIEGVIKPIKRPDIDNLDKTIMDALNGYAYIDDSQVVKKVTEKVYAIEDYVVVTINKI